MRELKFRVWDSKSRQYCAVELGNGRYAIHLNTKGIEGFSFGSHCLWQQYTGLRDRNGKEIYEGDILRHAGSGEITSVAWHGTMAGFVYNRPKDGKPHSSDYWWGELFRAHVHREVIGNIYDNPELLEQKDAA